MRIRCLFHLRSTPLIFLGLLMILCWAPVDAVSGDDSPDVVVAIQPTIPAAATPLDVLGSGLLSLERPSPLSPADGATLQDNTDVLLEWTAVPGATEYAVELWNEFDQVSYSGRIDHTSWNAGLLAPGTYRWIVEAYNLDGWSGWSDFQSFIVAARPAPDKPIHLAPGDGSHLPEATSIALAWSAAEHATEYAVEVWAGNVLIHYSGRITDTSWDLGQFSPGEYAWHVEAYDQGEYSGWTDYWRFYVDPSTPPPTTPALQSPDDGASLPAGADEWLAWRSVADATTYEVEVRSADSQWRESELLDTTTWRASALPPGIYYWRVRAQNQAGVSAWSEEWQLFMTVPGRTVVYVRASATGADDGSSWTDAYTDLQQAIALTGAGSEIWVAQGEYKPTSDSDRTVAFRLKPEVNLYGGFAGHETARSQRSWQTNRTILSGDLGSGGNLGDNSYHVVVADFSTGSTRLDGFIVQGGNADGDNEYAGGGGIYSTVRDDEGGLFLVNVEITGNRAQKWGGGAFFAIAAGGLVNVSFDNNEAGEGGGGFAAYGVMPLEMSNVRFFANRAEQKGGAIYVDSVQLVLDNCSVAGNFAGELTGGVVVAGHRASLTAVNCIFWENGATADPHFAAIARDSLGPPPAPNVTYSVVPGGYPGQGNLDVDPEFIAFSSGGLQLAADSPAINAGDNDSLAEDYMDVDDNGDQTERLPLDLDGEPRIVNLVVDMGAYEEQSFTPPARACIHLAGAGSNIRLAIVPGGFDDADASDVAKFNQLAALIAAAMVDTEPYASNLDKISIWRADDYAARSVDMESHDVWYNQTLVAAAEVCNYNQILVIAHNSGWAGGAPGYFSVTGSGTPLTCDRQSCSGVGCPSTPSCSWDESVPFTALHETGHTFAGLGHTCYSVDNLAVRQRPQNCSEQFSGQADNLCVDWQAPAVTRWLRAGDPPIGCFAGCDENPLWYRPWETFDTIMCRDDDLSHGFTPVERRLLEIRLLERPAVSTIGPAGGAFAVYAADLNEDVVAAGTQYVHRVQQQDAPIAIFDFGPGTLTQTTQLFYTDRSFPLVQTSALDENIFVERVFELSGLWSVNTHDDYNPPATLNPGSHFTALFAYDETALPPDVEETSLRLFRWDGATSTWVEEPGAAVNTGANTLTAPLDSFQTWAIMGSSSPPDGDARLYLPLVSK